MTQYARTHASALAKVQAKGGAADFTVTTAGTEDANGQRSGDVTTTTPGFATEDYDTGNLSAYEQQKLVSVTTLRLFWVPTTYGQVPPKNAKVLWGGQTYTVVSSDPYSPDGTPIFAYVVVSK